MGRMSSDRRRCLCCHFSNHCCNWSVLDNILPRQKIIPGILLTHRESGFPILIIALIPFRVYAIPKWFNQHELNVLDDLTANNRCVLESLGGEPRFPGRARPEHVGLERQYSERKYGVDRQRFGSIHR